MDKTRRNTNILIGKRLREARKNLNYKQLDFADKLGVSEEHYRKFESGATGLSADKLLTLHCDFGIDPTYLITGACIKEFDMEYYIANCNREQKAEFTDRLVEYLSRMLKNY